MEIPPFVIIAVGVFGMTFGTGLMLYLFRETTPEQRARKRAADSMVQSIMIVISLVLALIASSWAWAYQTGDFMTAVVYTTVLMGVLAVALYGLQKFVLHIKQ